ncbi:MAG TPA: glycosyltransferase [Actinocrinis sp.]|jgi:glycosyltransferase involved in cell wall biosynthesis
MKLSILMAAYNEERTVVQAAAAVLAADYPCPIELIIVDDGSRDWTPELLAGIDDPRVTVHRHPVNRGKSAALGTGIKLATGTHMVPFDADLEYSADDIPRVVEPVVSGRAEVVYGVRSFGVNAEYHAFRYIVGNRALTFAANVMFGARIADLHTCLKLIPLPLVRSLELRSTGFGMDTELTARLLRAGIRPFEVPVSYRGRSHADGKKIGWRDGVACLRILARVRFSPAQPVSESALQPQSHPPSGDRADVPAQPAPQDPAGTADLTGAQAADVDDLTGAQSPDRADSSLLSMGEGLSG